jgi:hypothetical protein
MRARGVLYELKIESIGDIARTRELDIVMLKNVGRKTLAELRELAAAFGTSFADPIAWGAATRCTTPGCVRKLGHGVCHDMRTTATDRGMS